MSNNIILHGLDPRLDEILADTYYQLIYQEQVTAIATKLAGWSEGEADGIRKTIGRKIQKELDLLIPRLVKDFISHGMKEESAKQLASAIQACGSYSFNKCLAGSEKIALYYSDYETKEVVFPTVRELYLFYEYICGTKVIEAPKIECIKHTPDDYYLRCLGYKNLAVTINDMVNIEYSGICPVYKITLDNGLTVRATSNHKFPTPYGEKRLDSLTIRDYLYVLSTNEKNNDIDIQGIKSIIFDGYEDVYSIEMQAPYHNFMLASGIVSSNSHSVEYGLIAYQTAYLKANYPVEYMCSLLNANIDTTEDVIPYINECKRMGIKILPPDVSRGNLKFAPENGAIRVGLSYIKGISNITVDYTSKGSLSNFFTRNKYNKRVKEALVKSGALDCFNHTRAEQFAIALNIGEEVIAEGRKICIAKEKIKAKQEELAKSKEGTKKVATLKNQIENQYKAIAKSEARGKGLGESVGVDYDEAQGEIEVLGFTFHDKFEKYAVDNYQIYNKELSIQQKILADVTSIRKIKDRRGRDMAFISAVPYMGVKTDFVMFANNYQELKEGIYAFVVESNKIIKVGYGKKID